MSRPVTAAGDATMGIPGVFLSGHEGIGLVSSSSGRGNMTEREAIQRCLGGDHEAYGMVVRKIQRRALFVALRILRDEAEAQDAVQMSLVRAFERLEQFDPGRPFYPWFRVILKNECLKRIEKRKRETPHDQLPERVDQGRPGLQLEVRQALDRLDEKDRAVLALRHLEGRSYREIAGSLHIPQGTVMSRLHAARTRLRRILQEEP